MTDTQAMTGSAKGAGKLEVSQTEVAVELNGVHKWYGEFHVLRDINLKVMRGERIVIAGPSGSGKSTMIRCINRLEEHQKGQIIVDGIELTNDLKKIDEIRREVGMVFQHFNLFPHLTILENCTLAPIHVRKMPKKQAEEVAMHFLTRVKIPEQAHKYPGQLSGGQQQRLCIARTVAVRPKVILLDEPTSALDPISTSKVEELINDGKIGVLLGSPYGCYVLRTAVRCSSNEVREWLKPVVLEAMDSSNHSSLKNMWENILAYI